MKITLVASIGTKPWMSITKLPWLASETAQQAKAPTARPDNPSFIPRNHTVEKENQFQQVGP